MPEFLIPILNFVIPFTLFILISGLVYLISKKCRLIPTIFFYFFVSSVLLFVATLGLGSEYLELYENIIVKFGRYVPNQLPHYDNVLGIKLASDNQYAKVVSAI